MGIKKPITFYGRTAEELEKKGLAVSDDLIKRERDMQRTLNEMEEDLINE
jgi:hypothetical protein